MKQRNTKQCCVSPVRTCYALMHTRNQLTHQVKLSFVKINDKKRGLRKRQNRKKMIGTLTTQKCENDKIEAQIMLEH